MNQVARPRKTLVHTIRSLISVLSPVKPQSSPYWRQSWKQRVARSAGGAICCYFGVIIVLMALENRILFHPLRPDEGWFAPPNERVEDLELYTADGTRIHAWWCPIENWRPEQGALLYCHGNAGNVSCRGPMIANWQREMNSSVLIFDYPGFGKSEGKPGEAGCYAAANTAYEWLVQTKQVPPDRLLIYGGSLGGGVAVDLASRRLHRALILFKTFTSIPDAAQSVYFWLPARWLVRNRFNSVDRIGRCTQPVFIAHGTDDRLVPFTLGQQLFAAANEPKCFFAMPGVGHHSGFTREVYSALRVFLAEAEAPPRSQTETALPTD
jgi:fermentation-respiration switch protein FrsA (DUF1100 family)